MNDSKPIPVLLMVRELGIGGCERDLTKLAIGLDRSRFQPFVGCFRPEGLRSGELKAHDIPIIPFHVPSFASLAALHSARYMGRFIKTQGIRVVHAFDAPSDMFAIPVARFYRTRAVISSELSYRSLIIGRQHQLLMQLSARLAHKIVVNSAAVGTDLIEHRNIPAEKIVLNHNGIDVRAFSPEPRLRKVFPDASVVIGALCALRPEKRLDLLLDAFAQVTNDLPGLRLLVVGSGPMLGALQEQCRRLNLQDFCHFEPSKTDVAEWLRSIDIFVMSSESESFPNALLEAMACGCCVVGSRVGGVPELITPERNGLLFEPRSVPDLVTAFRQLIRDSQLRRRLAHEAVRTAREEFPMEAVVARMQNLYLTLLNRVP